MAGIRSPRCFIWSEVSAPDRVRVSSRWTSSTRTSFVSSRHSRWQTASVICAWFMRAAIGMPRNRANSLTSILGVEAGGTARKTTGRRSVRPGCRRCSASSKVRPISSRVVVLPVVGGPETIRPRRAVPCWRRLRSIRRRSDREMRSMAGVVSTTNREW
ncbi:hypothetical protein SMF913_24987 [Streptomyces malaysiensis]|uniref:Uncharacterized protein n=1 Tax=Streptomyces malaysiensis TaxID=92644 RepID=A0A2J7YNB9_STRMQ|nr:hypothetical protein SMF913_24987 [Streptomyces malaysiensis]